MLDKLAQKRAVLVAQRDQYLANLNLTIGAIAILDELIGEAQAEAAAAETAAAAKFEADRAAATAAAEEAPHPDSLPARSGEREETAITYAPKIDARGCDAQAVERLVGAMAKDRKKAVVGRPIQNG